MTRAAAPVCGRSRGQRDDRQHRRRLGLAGQAAAWAGPILVSLPPRPGVVRTPPGAAARPLAAFHRPGGAGLRPAGAARAAAALALAPGGAGAPRRSQILGALVGACRAPRAL